MVSFTFSCSNQNDTKNSYDFTERLKIHHSKELILSKDFLIPQAICIYDSVIIIEDKNQGFFFHAYNLNTGNKYADFGNSGVGPGDFNMPTTMFVDKNKSELVVLDQNRSQISYYKIKDIINNNFNNFHQDQINQNASRIIQQNDSVLYCLGLFSEGMIRKDIRGKTIGYDLNYPEIPNEKLTPVEKFLLFQGEIMMKPDKSKFVYISTRCDLLKIIAIEKDSLKEIITLNTYFPKFKKEPSGIAISRENALGFTSIATTDKYIYALFSGRDMVQYPENFYFSDYIYVIDWNGNLIKKIILDKDAWKMCIDEESKKLYTIHFEMEKYDSNVQFFVYDDVL
ncbi:hypothetical protein FACS189426_22340 [Bacteroidia bacterium]|nr:hypothetical protein FACS189426_22340 [Bacteroidia bacterium]